MIERPGHARVCVCVSVRQQLVKTLSAERAHCSLHSSRATLQLLAVLLCHLEVAAR